VRRGNKISTSFEYMYLTCGRLWHKTFLYLIFFFITTGTPKAYMQYWKLKYTAYWVWTCDTPHVLCYSSLSHLYVILFSPSSLSRSLLTLFFTFVLCLCIGTLYFALSLYGCSPFPHLYVLILYGYSALCSNLTRVPDILFCLTAFSRDLLHSERSI
jgi:hypothetical protein